MRKSLLIIAAFFLISFFVFGNNTEVFFAQDDFIFIEKFTQNSLFGNITKVFSFADTHFRPVDNLYFLTVGNLFGKNYAYYHLSSLFIHTLSGFAVFLVAIKFFRRTFPALVSAIFYLVNSSHFVSLFWIAGNAVEIGFLLFCISLLFWIQRKFIFSLLFFMLSILASEAFLVGIVVIGTYEMTIGKRLKRKAWLIKFGITVLLVGILRLIYLVPKAIYDTYQLEFSLKTFSAIKYYLLRTAGFSEFSGDLLASLVLLALFGVVIKRIIDMDLELRRFGFFVSILILGLFPFVLLPNHLSPHYMALSIFGLSLIIATALSKRNKINYFLLGIFLIVSVVNVSQLQNNHWVVIKSRIAEAYIKQIESSLATTPADSTLIFNDNRISSSLDAYLALGGGKAIDFWFKDKKFKYCFSEFEVCNALP